MKLLVLDLKKAHKKLICKKKRDQNISFNDTLRNANRERNSGRFWDWVRRKASLSQLMLDEWGNHFVEYGLEQKCIDFLEVNNEELDADITVDEVRAIIRKLKTGK